MPKKIKHPKLPNGFGSIKKLSGNRTNPYAVYPPTKEFNNNGSPITQPALCYVNDWYIGFYALMEYKNGTFDREKISRIEIKDNDKKDIVIQKILASYNNQYCVTKEKKTFSEVYEMFFDWKFNKDKTRVYSNSTIYATKAGFNNCKSIHDMPFEDIKTEDMQKIIDDCPLKHASKEHILNLFNQMYDYADANDLCVKKYSEYVKINTADDDEKGIPFTEYEINKIWDNSKNNSVLQCILIMIYSGYRIGAYKEIEINFEEQYFKGGVKTKAGKGRIVPFNKNIIPFINRKKELFCLRQSDFRKLFNEELNNIGITGHTPHDCRHTFSWLCDVFKVDDISKKMMLGHSLGNDVTSLVYAHRTTEELRTEINKIERKICH